MSSQRLSRIAAALKQDVDNGRMPGAVIAIARRGKLVYYESFGFLDKGKGTPMPKDAIFSIASVTRFDLAAFAPHPPGYPVYVLCARAFDLVAFNPVRACGLVSRVRSS